MQTAPPTPFESQRVALLHALQLLDTPPDQAFDRITGLLARMLGVPIALVSLVDTDRQWFKSRIGLDASETPRDHAFCAHAIHGDDLFVVPDARADLRFSDNPLVTGAPHVRAYAGYPLRSSEGHALGTLCAIDHDPRHFGDDELALLRALGELAQRELLHREAALRARALADSTLHAVRESEALYHASFDHAAVGMAIVALDGRWQQVNPALCRILGRDAATLAQRDVQSVTHPDDLDLDLCHARQLVAGATSHYTMEKRYLRPDGSTVWANLTVTLLRRDGKPLHFIAVVEDISARREAEQALHQLRQSLEERVAQRTSELRAANDELSAAMRQRQESQEALARSEADLRAVLDQAHDAFVSIDAAGVVLDWNRQAEATFGWCRDEAIGRRLDVLIVPPDHRAGHRQGVQRLSAGGGGHLLNQRMELPALCRDGRVIPCEVTLWPLNSSARGQIYAAFMHDISQRKAAEQALAASEQRLNAVVHDQTDVVLRFDHRGTLVFANATAQRMFALDGTGPWTDPWQQRVDSRDLCKTVASARSLGPGHAVDIVDIRVHLADCSIRWMELINRALFDDQGRLCEVQTVGRDISERKTLAAQLAAQNRELQLMLDSETIGMLRLRGRVAAWTNRGIARIFGWGPGELDGRSARQLLPDDEGFHALLAAADPVLRAGGTFRSQLCMQRRDGTPVWIDLSGVQLDETGDESMWMLADITAMKQQQAATERLAFHDALTGLPNRLLLRERLRLALPHGTGAGRLVAVAFIDLDGFKAVNDLHGHEAGDWLLRAVGQRLEACVRRHDTVARLGGDEFVLVLSQLASPAECRSIVERARAAIAEPVALPGGLLARVSGSIGLALCPQDAQDVDAALAFADRQMYRAKQAGKNCIAQAA